MPYTHLQGLAAMNREQDDNTGFSDAESDGLSQNPFDKARPSQQDFDPFDDDGYEEPDRDTDHPGAYAEEHFQEEEDLDDLFPDNDLFEDEDEPANTEPPASYDAPRGALEELEHLAGAHDLDANDEHDGFDIDEEPDSEAMTDVDAPLVARSWDNLDTETGEPASWQREDEFLDDGELDSQAWPMGLIAVAVLALVLLIAGGYGVIQQRKATGEEIRQLRAELATATSAREVEEARNALQAMKARNDELQASITTLTRENRRLSDTVGGLEAQLDAQQAALATAATATAPVATPEPAAVVPAASTPAAKPVNEPTAASAPLAENSWFVNFGSYGNREVARDWVAKLNPASGETILIATEVNGKTLYRVRVVGLSGRESAEQIARSLEQEYKLPKLWVGKQ